MPSASVARPRAHTRTGITGSGDAASFRTRSSPSSCRSRPWFRQPRKTVRMGVGASTKWMAVGTGPVRRGNRVHVHSGYPRDHRADRLGDVKPVGDRRLRRGAVHRGVDPIRRRRCTSSRPTLSENLSARAWLSYKPVQRTLYGVTGWGSPVEYTAETAACVGIGSAVIFGITPAAIACAQPSLQDCEDSNGRGRVTPVSPASYAPRRRCFCISPVSPCVHGRKPSRCHTGNLATKLTTFLKSAAQKE